MLVVRSDAPSKPSKNNQKRVVSGHTNAQSLMWYTNDCVALPSVTIARVGDVIDDDAYLQAIIDELPRLYRDLENFRYRCHNGKVLSWDRIHPSYCAFGRCEYTNNNTLNVGEHVGIGCRHDATRAIEYIMVGSKGTLSGDKSDFAYQ